MKDGIKHIIDYLILLKPRHLQKWMQEQGNWVWWYLVGSAIYVHRLFAVVLQMLEWLLGNDISPVL